MKLPVIRPCEGSKPSISYTTGGLSPSRLSTNSAPFHKSTCRSSPFLKLSFGGEVAPIAASGDDRNYAYITIDGVNSVRRAWEEQFPETIVALFNQSKVAEFDYATNAVLVNTTVPTSFRWIVGFKYVIACPFPQIHH